MLLSSKTLRLGSMTLSFLVPLGLAIHGLSPDSLIAEEKLAADKKASWDVQNPGLPTKSVQIKTDRFTWSDVDVSPDGRFLVFDALGDLYRVPISGGKAESLTQGLAYDFQARFAPDGKSLIFVSDRKGADNLWSLDLQTKELKQLTEEKEHSLHSPAISPDGLSIAARKSFVGTRSIPGGEIWLFDRRGGGGAQVRELLHGKGTQKNITDPYFSADGRYLYYALDATEGKTWQYNKNARDEIFVIRRWDREKGEEETVTGGAGGAIRPVLSRDGKLMAFIKRQGPRSALYLKNLASGDETLLFDQLDRDLQESDGTLGNAPFFQFTPDQKSIVFWAGGLIQQLQIEDKKVKAIPISLETSREVVVTPRVKVAVAESEMKVKMPRWVMRHPNQNQLIFQALGYLYRKDLGTGKIERLTSQTTDFEFYPSLSRDGKKLVYTTWNDQNLGSIRILDLANGRSEKVTQEPGHYVEPAFNPNASAIAYRKIPEGYLLDRKWSEQPGLYLLNLTNATKTLVSKDGFLPHFAMDKQRIYWLRKNSPGVELVSSQTDGMDAKVLAKGEDITQFLVSPNGQWIAFSEQFQVYVVPFLKTGKTLEWTQESKQASVLKLSQNSGEFLSWLSDSQALGWSQGGTYREQRLSDALPIVDTTKDQEAEKPRKLAKEPLKFDLNFAIESDQIKGITALVGAKIITMRNAEKEQDIIPVGTVLIENNRIVAIGPQDKVKIPSAALRIDLQGKTIIPGLIDAHAHGPQGSEELIPQQNWTNFSSLAFGVTTIHDPSNDTSEIFAASEMQKAGRIVGPRIFSTGTILYGAQGAGYKTQINSYEDAKFHVQRLKDAGAISVKSYQQPQRAQRQMLVKAGQELGMIVVPEGGSKFQYNLGMIIDGHQGIEHALPLAAIYDDVQQLWSQTVVGYTPTFVVAYGGLAGERYWYDRTEVWKNERLMRYVPRFVVEPISMRRETAPDSDYNHIAVSRIAKELREKGVGIHIGAHGQREGLAAHWELWMMEQGGMSPWQALRSGTIDGAKYLGMDEEIGSLEPGKLADLVVIDGDPLQDLKRSEFVQYTMINGRLYEAATMNEVGLRARARQLFHFEKSNAQSMQPLAHAMYREKAERHHWVH